MANQTAYRISLHWVSRTARFVFALSLVLIVTGCTRHYFRHRADEGVARVLDQKDKYPDWKIEQYHVYPDPRARFADPTNPDHPPMPPDDPAAHDLSPNPQVPGKAGVARVEGTGYLELLAKWDAMNRAEAAAKKDQEKAKDKAETEGKTEAKADATSEGEKPATVKPASFTTSLSSKPDATRPFLLKLDQTVELGLINSREYQDAREDLFLTALPVTLERFAFSPQLFDIEQLVRQRSGRKTPPPDGKHNRWEYNNNRGLAKLFSTGALLLVNIANSTILELGNGVPTISTSQLTLDLIQPLLRDGGRSVALEPLTQAERNLLYQIRNFARFRETFYVAIAGGGGGSITGATFQPTGVIAPSGFSPTGGVGGSGLFPGQPGIFAITGHPGLVTTPGQSGRLGLQVAFAAPVSGYLSTLLQAAQMRVDEYNIEKLEGYVDLGKTMAQLGDISQLQVDQFEQQVLTRRTTLLNDQLQYLTSLDQFKLQLGLPTDLSIELDDSPFRPLNQQFQRYEDLFKEFEAASNEPLAFGTLAMVPRLRGELRRIFTSSAIVKGTRFSTEIGARWDSWQKLSYDALEKRLAGFKEDRRKLQDKETDLQLKGQSLNVADQERLNKLNFDIDLGDFERVLREYESQPWKNLASAELRTRQQQGRFRYVVNAFILVAAEARTERVLKLRRDWPDLARLCVNGVDLLKTDVDEAQAEVTRTALANRLDLMNTRAQVVDAWRQLSVFANALLGRFNIEYRLDSFSPFVQAKPLAFGDGRNNHRLFLNLEPPLVRVAERNNYRASLINYQRARRILERAEDQVAFDVRGEIRQLREQEENYRIQQRQVELAYMTVENSLDTFKAPPAPIPAGAPVADTATRAAALTTQLISAQTALYNAQFAMTTIWITYLNTRLQLYRDMELMPLDFRGVWIDDVATCQCPADNADRTDDGSGKSGNKAPGNGQAGGTDERLGNEERLSKPILLPPPEGGPELE